MYGSGNRDEEVIENPNAFDHRPRASAPASLLRLLASHRCVGNRLAEMQLRGRVGRNPGRRLIEYRSDGRAGAHIFELREGLRDHAGSHRRMKQVFQHMLAWLAVTSAVQAAPSACLLRSEHAMIGAHSCSSAATSKAAVPSPTKNGRILWRVSSPKIFRMDSR